MHFCDVFQFTLTYIPSFLNKYYNRAWPKKTIMNYQENVCPFIQPVKFNKILIKLSEQQVSIRRGHIDNCL